MRKIKALLDKGWVIELPKQSNDGWFRVCASHNFWGDVEGRGKTLNNAINNMYEDVVKVEKGEIEGMYT